ncbi:MAG: hypothetical protein ABMA15_29550 [Vicinamibacterales bacterium]
MRATHRSIPFATALLVVGLLLSVTGGLIAQTRATTPAPYLVEWVYKAKWGYQDEFFDIFKKTQVPVLDREKQLGYIVDYTIYSGTSHRTGEDVRYDYRVVIAYKDEASSKHGSEVEKQVFPDQAAFKREDQKRWDLTLAHWDAPIRVLDPHGRP